MKAALPDNQASQRRTWVILAAIMLIAAGLRFYGLYWGFPYALHCDENQLIGPTQRLGESLLARGSPNPQFSVWGALPMYLAWIGAAPAHAVALITGQSWSVPDLLLLSGRTVSALADLLAVLLVFRLGARLSATAGLWGAALYAVALVGVRESHFFTADVLASSLMLLYLLGCERAAAQPSRRAFALCGLCLGLCLSVKVSSAPLALVALAVLWRLSVAGAHRGGDPAVSRLAQSARRVRAWSLAVMVVAVLPPTLWGLQREGIIARGKAALMERTDPSRLETHSPEFWLSQVKSVYRGVHRLLIMGAGGLTFLAGWALLATWGRRGPRMAHELRRRGPHLLTFAGVTVAVFVALNPYSVLTPADYWLPSGPTSVTWAMIQVSGALHPPPGWAIQFMGTVPVVYQLVHVIPYAWSPPLAVVLVAGFAFGLLRCRRGAAWPLWIVCVAAVLLGLTTMGLWMKMTRYLVPLTPLLCVLAGMMLASVLSAPRAWVRWAWGALGGVAWVAALLWCVGYVGIYGQEDNRVAAARWLAAHVRSGDIVALEKDDAWGAAGENMLRELTCATVRRFNPLETSHDRLGRAMDPEHIQLKQGYLAEALAGARWLVMTDNNRGRLRGVADAFPVMHDFYDRLFAGRTRFRQVASFEVGPTFLGRRVDDSRAEPSFRLFDHPRVYVFRAVETAPPGRDP